MVSPVETSRPRGLTLAFAVVFAVAVIVAFTLARRTGLAVFVPLASLGLWAVTIANRQFTAAPHVGPAYRVIILSLLAVAGVPAFFHVVRSAHFTGATDAALQLAAVVLAVLRSVFTSSRPTAATSRAKRPANCWSRWCRSPG
jgi:hypothetical protein